MNQKGYKITEHGTAELPWIIQKIETSRYNFFMKFFQESRCPKNCHFGSWFSEKFCPCFKTNPHETLADRLSDRPERH
jgi:hypothetical protein